MWKLSFVVFVSLFATAWLVHAVEDSPAAKSEGETAFSQEIECSKAGGICIPRQTCPPDHVSEEGQCPKQSNLGAVCCHSLPSTETRCAQLGGKCMNTCPETIIIGRAADCPEGEKCCPLV